MVLFTMLLDIIQLGLYFPGVQAQVDREDRKSMRCNTLCKIPSIAVVLL